VFVTTHERARYRAARAPVACATAFTAPVYGEAIATVVGGGGGGGDVVIGVVTTGVVVAGSATVVGATRVVGEVCGTNVVSATGAAVLSLELPLLE
jgi:hypothetical protein